MSKTVLITGAGSGFGRGAAIALAARGHQVIATVYDDDQVADLTVAHPELTVAKLDITNPVDVATVDQWEIDVLINNAALGQTGPLSRIPLDLVRRVFETNVFGTLAITQRVADQMKNRRAGRILIVSSIAGLFAGPGSGPYSMTKHALQAMGSALRAELAPFGIDVALINPGPFATGFNDRMAHNPGDWFDPGTAPPEDVAMMEQLEQRITVGQFDPPDVIQVYVDLVEAESTELVNLIPPDIVERFSGSR
ncbi:MAG: short-chain dehydrogenase [Actinobacteria bacterium]|nr:MAG: short-chain dehydrogenase [Actinomycetota bacterium]